MTVEEKLINTIIAEQFTDHYLVREIEYPPELNAVVLVATNGKKYRVTIVEEPCEQEIFFN